MSEDEERAVVEFCNMRCRCGGMWIAPRQKEDVERRYVETKCADCGEKREAQLQ